MAHSRIPFTANPAPPEARAAPASAAQEQLWALLQLHPDRPLGNYPVALNIEGPLDAAQLTRALNDLVARHAILRTNFDFQQGRPVQRVVAALHVPLPVIDLRLLPAAVREAQAFRLAREDVARPFDVRQGPLLRGQLFLFEQTRHILVLTFHRGILDEESIALLLRELAASYAARSAGGEPALPPVALTYGDYAAQGPDASAREACLSWWSEQLAGEPAPVQLPADRSRSGTRSGNTRVERLSLPAALPDAVENLAQREGTNPFTVLLAAFQVLLHRYTSRSDFVLGLAASDRPLPGMETMLGPCTRIVPCRATLSGDPTFRQLLDRVRRDTLAIYAHSARMPFDGLPGRFRNPAIACPVQFFHERRDLDQGGWPGLRIQELELDTGACPCELAFHVVEGLGRWSLRAEYDAEAFSPTVIQQMLSHFSVLLHAAATRPASRLSELPLLTPVERRRLLTEWNSSSVVYPRDATVHELVARRAITEPAALAVASAATSLTYRELDQRSNQLGRHLRAAGVRPGHVVGLGVERSPAFVVAVLGILKAGGAVLPLETRVPFSVRQPGAARLSLILTDSGHREHFAPELNRLLLLDLEAADIHRTDDAELAPLAGPDDLAWVVRTNGTGGEAKAVELSHRAIVNSLHAFRRLCNLTPADTFVGLSTAGSIEALTELLLPLVFGARLALVPHGDLADASRLAAALSAAHPTVAQAAPSRWQQLLDAGWGGDKSLRLLASGECLTREVADRLLSCGSQVWNVYATAESAGACLAAPVMPGSGRPLVGRAMGNAQIHVLDAHLQPVPVGITGEIYVGGDALSAGYRDRPADTIAHFPVDPFRHTPGARLFRTGDLARRLPNGELDHLGRLDGKIARRPVGPLPGTPSVRPTDKESNPPLPNPATGETRDALLAAPQPAAG